MFPESSYWWKNVFNQLHYVDTFKFGRGNLKDSHIMPKKGFWRHLKTVMSPAAIWTFIWWLTDSTNENRPGHSIRIILLIFLGSIWARDKPNTNFHILISRAFTWTHQIVIPTNSTADIRQNMILSHLFYP